ncbi:MAG: AMP-binding protein [Betaproteobacteria bacterium]|nr:AMP-binding protein [Betaproteobacteria bacterium]
MTPHDYACWPKQYPRSLAVPETSLWFNLSVSAARFPGKAATVFYGARLTYRDLLDQTERLAGHLRSVCGVRAGDRVLLFMQSSPQFIAAYYGILRADAVVVPVSPMNVTEELEHNLADSGARVAIVGQELFDRIEPLIGRLADHVVVAAYADALTGDAPVEAPAFVRDPARPVATRGAVAWSEALAADHRPGPHEARGSDLAAILYTSGTTGRPKGCMHTHRTVMCTLAGAAMWEGMHQESVILATAPMFHVTGMQHSMNAPLYAGATIVFLPRWDPAVAGDLIERYGCTHWANVPTMVVDLLAHPSTRDRDLSSLVCIAGGGASMPEAVARELQARCGIEYMEAYGMTESISQTHFNPPDDLRKQCLGIPTFDTESLVIDPETLRVLGAGEVGEIVSRGPQIMLGYWGNPDATRAAFVEIDGRRFLRTGDLGRIDEDGFFYIADRLKRMINASGYKVWPAEVEATLFKHPAIKEACVIGAPDPRRGETVKAIVVLRDGLSPPPTSDDVIAWARDHMAAYKVPRLVSFVDALPRSGTGKVQWRALQEAEWAGKPS